MADYDLKLGAVDVDVGGLGPLADLASVIAPQVGEVVKRKISEVMDGDVKITVNYHHQYPRNMKKTRIQSGHLFWPEPISSVYKFL